MSDSTDRTEGDLDWRIESLIGGDSYIWVVERDDEIVATSHQAFRSEKAAEAHLSSLKRLLEELEID